MEKSRFPRGYKVYLPLVVLFVLLTLVMPRSPKFQYDYQKGAPWMYEDLVSEFDFPLLKSEEQLKSDLQKAGSSVIPVFRYDPSVFQSAQSALASAELGKYSSARPALNVALQDIYSKGILPASHQSDIVGFVYVQRDMRAAKVPVEELYTIVEAEDALRSSLASVLPEAPVDSIYNAFLAPLVSSDLVFDQQVTDLIHEENVALVSPTLGVVKAGQTLVSKGELVTADLELLLDSYKKEYEANVGYDGPVFLQWLGNALIALFLVLILFFSIYFCNYHIFEQVNKYLYILLVFTISAVSSFLVVEIEPAFFYMVPFTLIVLYLLAFFTRRLVLIVYLISLLPMLIAAPDGVELFFIYLAGGNAAIDVGDY